MKSKVPRSTCIRCSVLLLPSLRAKRAWCIPCWEQHESTWIRTPTYGYDYFKKSALRRVKSLRKSSPAGFNFDVETVITLLKAHRARGSFCEICHEAEADRAHCLDHRHDTGRFRGVVCVACNTRIKHVERGHSVTRIDLKPAIDQYLQKWGKDGA